MGQSNLTFLMTISFEEENFWIQSLPFKLIYDLPRFTFYRIETFRLTSYFRIFPSIFLISSLQQSIVECTRKGNENNWNKKEEKMKIWSGKFKFISFLFHKKTFFPEDEIQGLTNKLSFLWVSKDICYLPCYLSCYHLMSIPGDSLTWYQGLNVCVLVCMCACVHFCVLLVSWLVSRLVSRLSTCVYCLHTLLQSFCMKENAHSYIRSYTHAFIHTLIHC